MDETISRNFSVDPDSFEVPKQSSVDKANRLVYRTNENKPATNLEEIQKQNTINQNKIKEKENEAKSPTSKHLPTPNNLEDKKEKKPYYGRTLVIVILIFIIVEYYVYVFERLDNNKKGKNNINN